MWRRYFPGRHGASMARTCYLFLLANYPNAITTLTGRTVRSTADRLGRW